MNAEIYSNAVTLMNESCYLDLKPRVGERAYFTASAGIGI